jgi:hypothetical protein
MNVRCPNEPPKPHLNFPENVGNLSPVILLDWTGVDLTPKSTPYAAEAVELQDSNIAPDQIYTINSKSWQKVKKKVRNKERTKSTPNHKASK